MAQSFDASHKAYESGDGAGAKHLSEEGKRHKAEMERLNQEASDWIYRRAYLLLCTRRFDEVLIWDMRDRVGVENNTDSAPDEVDLHGLYVAEAIRRTEEAIQQAQAAGKDHLDLIVGKVCISPPSPLARTNVFFVLVARASTPPPTPPK